MADEGAGMNDQAIEQEIQAKGLTAPRVTPDDVAANIVSEHYFTAAQAVSYTSGTVPPAPLDLLTFCVLVLRNGFTVTGESACASPENFDAELGRKIARQNAVAKVWPLMGYELKERLHREARGDVNQHANEQLRWHGQLRNDLMDVLKIDDPANILRNVRDLKHWMDGLEK